MHIKYIRLFRGTEPGNRTGSSLAMQHSTFLYYFECDDLRRMKIKGQLPN